MKKILLSIIALLGITQAWGYNVGNTFTAQTVEGVTMSFKVTSVEDMTCDVAYRFDYRTTTGTVTIPSEVEGFSVTGFEEGACMYGTMENVIIPSSVTSIGNSAFEECSNLTSVNIPSSVTSIGNSAFKKCNNLTSISIPNSVITIGNQAFYGCSKLTGVIIPSSVISIGSSSFNLCESLTDIVIPYNLMNIGERAFSYCRKLTSVTILSPLTSISSYAFSDCVNLTGITIPSSVTSIESYAFYESGLTSINIPPQVTSIGDYAFQDTNLENVTIPSSVITIGQHAFYRTKLTSLTIPSSVTSIGQEAFYCSTLTSVTVNTNTPPTYGYNAFSNSANATLYVPSGTKSAYKTATGWNSFKEIVELAPVPIEPFATVTMSANGISTFSSSSDLDFSGVSGLKAYIVSGFSPSEGTLVLTPVTEVPAGTGLLLKGAEGSYEVPYTTTDMYYSNLLTGVTTATEISPTSGSETNFILANGIHGINFYTLSEAGELAAGKAYLHLPTSAVSALSRGFRLVFEDETTGIDEKVSANVRATASEQVYDLQGRRIAKPTAGIYIVNGKKVIIK